MGEHHLVTKGLADIVNAGREIGARSQRAC